MNTLQHASESATAKKSSSFSPHFFQPKLSINSPGDSHEQEADAMADKVMRMKNPEKTDTFFSPSISSIQRKCASCEEEEKVHRKETSGSEVQGSNELDNYVSSISSSGQALPESSRQFFEPRFGQDFSNVKIHTDSVAAKSAQSINALAYTTGNNIVFNQGQYSPNSESGQRLMAHELTHVVQQGTQLKTKLIQRLECDLTHLDTECGGAAASCHTVDAYCTEKYPKDSDITGLYNTVTKEANDHAAKLPLSAKNLLHFLDGTGTLMKMPSATFATAPGTKLKLKDEHRKKFIAGAITRLNDGRLKPGGSVDMVWMGTANPPITPPSDLTTAVGGYTLCSKVTVQAIAQGSGNFKIVFSKWTVQAFDCYNWDPGKGIVVGGFKDKDFCCLQNKNKGKHFRIESDVWVNTDPESTKDEIVSATPPATPSPVPATPKAP